MTHEDFRRRLPAPSLSNRVFGLALGGMLMAAALLPRLHGASPRWRVAALAAAVWGTALAAPRVLGPLRSVWMRLAHLGGMAVSYVICAFLLYLVFTPAGLLLGRRKKDALRLRWDPQAESYWIRRDPPGPAPETMMHQY